MTVNLSLIHICSTLLNFEEFSTVLAQVEACLNLRPLFTMSNDAGDPEPLTPAHFLVGSPLTALPEPDYSDVNMGRLGRWQLLQRFTRSIWKSGSRDYLHQLQQRNKWKRHSKNLSIGQLVLILEDNTPPLQWKRGIVTQTYLGQDSLVRIADVRTANGILRRPIHKLCPLPVSYTHLDVYKRQAYNAPQVELNAFDTALPQTAEVRR